MWEATRTYGWRRFLRTASGDVLALIIIVSWNRRPSSAAAKTRVLTAARRRPPQAFSTAFQFSLEYMKRNERAKYWAASHSLSSAALGGGTDSQTTYRLYRSQALSAMTPVVVVIINMVLSRVRAPAAPFWPRPVEQQSEANTGRPSPSH